jgi:hypothetical protein
VKEIEGDPTFGIHELHYVPALRYFTRDYGFREDSTTVGELYGFEIKQALKTVANVMKFAEGTLTWRRVAQTIETANHNIYHYYRRAFNYEGGREAFKTVVRTYTDVLRMRLSGMVAAQNSYTLRWPVELHLILGVDNIVHDQQEKLMTLWNMKQQVWVNQEVAAGREAQLVDEQGIARHHPPTPEEISAQDKRQQFMQKLTNLWHGDAYERARAEFRSTAAVCYAADAAIRGNMHVARAEDLLARCLRRMDRSTMAAYKTHTRNFMTEYVATAHGILQELAQEYLDDSLVQISLAEKIAAPVPVNWTWLDMDGDMRLVQHIIEGNHPFTVRQQINYDGPLLQPPDNYQLPARDPAYTDEPRHGGVRRRE